MVVALLCLAQFVVVLDATIVAIALPAIQDDLGLSTTALGWVITAYTLVFGGRLLAAGRLADRVGRRRAFAAGLCCSPRASLACGLAPDGAALLGARAVQGLGAAVVAPAALALLTTARPTGRAHARALGVVDGGRRGRRRERLGARRPARGLLGWRWVFFVNVPGLPGGGRAARPACCRNGARGPPRRPTSPARCWPPWASARSCSGSRVQVRGPRAARRSARWPRVALGLAFARVEARAATRCSPRRSAPCARRGAQRRRAVLTATTTPPMFLCTLYAQRVLGLGPAAAGLLFPPFNLAVVAGSLAGPRGRGRRGRAPRDGRRDCSPSPRARSP